MALNLLLKYGEKFLKQDDFIPIPADEVQDAFTIFLDLHNHLSSGRPLPKKWKRK